MNLPNDPVMLLSVMNTQLRDHYNSLESLAENNDMSEEELRDIVTKLSNIDYMYDAASNQFK